MQIKRHCQATTIPKVRAAMQVSDEPAWILAERYGTTEQTVRKWRKRDGVTDRSCTPYRLPTTLTPAQEVVDVARRRTLLVSLDDFLEMVRKFLNPNVLRSALDRCLRKHDSKGEQAFNELRIEHRLTLPKSPHTNGMVERSNGRIETVFQRHAFRPGEQLETTLCHHVWHYNQPPLQSTSGNMRILQAMQDWHSLKSVLFMKPPYHLPAYDACLRQNLNQ